MVTPEEVTILIPVYALKEHRIKNLEYILPFILKTGCQIYVVEQTSNSTLNLEHFTNNFKNLNHVLFDSNEEIIHKTGIINYGISNYVKTKYAWITDVDFYMKFESVFTETWNSPFIQPYDFAKKLSEKESDKLISGKTVNIKFNDAKAQYISMYGALSFICDVSTFLSIGGMDNAIYGCGKEDEELAVRVKKTHNVQILNFKGVHLYHPIDKSKKPFIRRPTSISAPTPIHISQESTLIQKVETCSEFLDDFFDKIYCINLDDREDRWETVQEQFDEFGIKVSRFSAIDCRGFKEDKINGGELGCLRSHLAVVKDAKHNNYKRILIFEDDVMLSKEFAYRIFEIKNINWKLLYLGATQFEWESVDMLDGKYLCKKTMGTFAYAIDHTLFDDVIKKFETESLAADYLLNEVQDEHRGDCFTLYPNIAIADVRESDIRFAMNMFDYASKSKWNTKHFSQFDHVKKILLVADTRNWAFDNIAKAIKKYNPDPQNVYYEIVYAREMYEKNIQICKSDWDLIYVMFEGERIIPDGNNVIRGCYSAFWMEYKAYTPKFISEYFSNCAGAVFVNPELKRVFSPYLPADFASEVIYDASDENLFYPIKNKKNEKFTVLFVGNTKRPIKNFKIIEKICAMADVDLNVCSNIPNNELVYEYNKADLLINFSDFEGGPQTFIEAALCEIPTLIRDTNELSKIVPCFVGKDENEFVNILKHLKHNRYECEEMGKKAYTVAIQDFTYKKTAEKFTEFFSSFCTNFLKEKLTVFVITSGNNPNYVDCVRALRSQTCSFELKVIKDIAPMSKAFQRMIDECKTEYYIQVDGDMVLNPEAIWTIYETLVTSDSNISTVAYMLKDSHLDFNLYGIKGYKHDILKNYPYNLEIISCEVDQVRRLQGDGYHTLMVNKPVGLHSPKWNSSLIYERYFDLMEKWKIFKYDWMGELPSKLLEIFKTNPTDINFYALSGAMMSLSTDAPIRNREKNFLIEDSGFNKIKNLFENRTFKYMINKEVKNPEVLSREHMFGENNP